MLHKLYMYFLYFLSFYFLSVLSDRSTSNDSPGAVWGSTFWWVGEGGKSCSPIAFAPESYHFFLTLHGLVPVLPEISN